MNSIILSLTVAMSPEIRYTETGTITSSILCLIGSCLIRVECWGKLAEATKAFQVDSPLIVTGALHVVQNSSFKVAAASIQPGAPGLNLNLACVVGRAGGDPQTRFFDPEKGVSKFRLAIKRKQEITDWVNVEFWDRTAEICTDYVRKGSLVSINGQLKIETWDDKNTGSPRSKPIINGDKLHLLGGNNKSEQRQPVAA